MDDTLSEESNMPVQDYIARVIEINNYREEFLPVITGRNATKLPGDELLDLLEFRIPIKWQRQLQVQNFEPTAGTLHDFQDFCKRLESALDDPPVDNKSNKTSRQEKGNKKFRQNNNNNKDKNNFCMLHGHNPTHSTKQCRTLKKRRKSTKKVVKMVIVKIPSVGTIQAKRRFT